MPYTVAVYMVRDFEAGTGGSEEAIGRLTGAIFGILVMPWPEGIIVYNQVFSRASRLQLSTFIRFAGQEGPLI